MLVQELNWDSNFFGYKVGKVILSNNDLDVAELLSNDFKLIYIFSSEKINFENNQKLKPFLADEKIELEINLDNIKLDDSPNSSIVELSEVTNDLVELALQSGHYSRFKVDSNFKNNEFEKLYHKWLEQSIKHENAVKVFGYTINQKIEGFVTIGNKNNCFDIGLIAVNENQRGNNIGKQLIQEVFKFALQENKKKVTVTTQLQNKGAMKFYINNGFTIFNTTYIYHLWK